MKIYPIDTKIQQENQMKEQQNGLYLYMCMCVYVYLLKI